MAEVGQSVSGNSRRKAAITQTVVDETNHRAANSFQIIGSLVARRARKSTSAGVRAELLAIGTAVGAMEFAHKHLYVCNAEAIDLCGYLEDLVNSISTYAALCGDTRIVFEPKTHDHLVVAPQVAIRLGLIVSELVTNSIKYAGPAATCRVAVASDGPQLTVEVSDTGPGLASVPGATSGLKIVTAPVSSLEGSLCFIPAREGPRFLISLSMSAGANRANALIDNI
jgi:two-component sensor histidine kinase